jgi:hypothetical protein
MVIADLIATMKKHPYTWKHLVLALGMLILLCLVGRLAGLHFAERYLAAKLRGLGEQGITVTYTGLQVGPWNTDLLMTGVEVCRLEQGDTLVKASADLLEIRGVSVYQFLFHRNIAIGLIHVASPHVRMKEHTPADSSNVKKQKAMVTAILAEQVLISDAVLEMLDTAGKTTALVRLQELGLASLKADSLGGITNWQLGNAYINELMVKAPKDFYDFRFKGMVYDRSGETFRMDSVFILPFYNKETFARRSAKEIDRFSGSLNSLQVQGFAFGTSPRLHLRARHARVNFSIESYRDKRQPFLKDHRTPLPVELLADMPFGFVIDTVSVENSYASYEEFPEKNDFPGKVVFENLDASLYHITQPMQEQGPVMEARAMLMGKGKLLASFRFPQEAGGRYTVRGSLKDFELPAINPMLESEAKMRIETGYLQALNFEFGYNDTRSEGVLSMDYRDLKIAALQAAQPKKKAGLKSMIVNLLLVRKEEPGQPEQYHKEGTIGFTRDQKRSIFNYWWKSLLSGIKEAHLSGDAGTKEPKR